MSTEKKTDRWDESYQRQENHIFYPKDEVVKFINRYVIKRRGIDDFKAHGEFTTALDYGCGIGRQTCLLADFGLKTTGLDISKVAIEKANSWKNQFSKTPERVEFAVTQGEKLDFADESFDITVCESVLDSMNFELASGLLKEFHRVTKHYVFVSFITDQEGQREELVQTEHEKGTFQSYYTWDQLQRWTQELNFEIKEAYRMDETPLVSERSFSRIYMVLNKGNNQ